MKKIRANDAQDALENAEAECDEEEILRDAGADENGDPVVEAAFARLETAGWYEMSPAARKKYLKEHPNSQYSPNAKGPRKRTDKERAARERRLRKAARNIGN